MPTASRNGARASADSAVDRARVRLEGAAARRRKNAVHRHAIRTLVTLALAAFVLITSASCRRSVAARTFATPEEAVRALIGAVATENVDDLLKIFAPDGQNLVDLSDPAAARLRRQVFVAASLERWQLIDQDGAKILVVGNEQWPFPVPLVSGGGGWHFDTAAGKEEIIARRIGRNELFVIYAARGYVARTTLPRREVTTPFHGYYFRTLTTPQSPALAGARRLALVAWPAEYDVTGVMTFVVSADGVVHQKDLGAESTATARTMPVTDLDASWTPVR